MLAYSGFVFLRIFVICSALVFTPTENRKQMQRLFNKRDSKRFEDIGIFFKVT